jgi:hypothetical protein
MSTPAATITFKTIQEMMPEYNLPPDLLEDLVAALPPPPDDAPDDWRLVRMDRVVEGIASRVPMNAAQASLAGLIVVTEGLALDMASRAGAKGLELAETVRLVRAADALTQSVTRLERTLERRQARVMPFRDVRPVDGADLVALARAWSRRKVEPVAGGAAAAVPIRGKRPGAVPWSMPDGRTELEVRDGAWCDRATTEKAPSPRPAAPVAAPSERQAAPPREPMRSRDGVTVEQGDGYTMEVWPARPGAGTAP